MAFATAIPSRVLARIRSASNSAGVGQRPSQAIKLGHYKGVTVAAGGERFAKAGPFALGTARSVIDIDEVWIHAGGRESVALGGQVLGVGGDAGVADKHDAEFSV
ncbi:hypothetical protein FBY36_2200 [Arthrobacter sp. SLBN-122]|nr:hypothetical protein FBY36_2200 [Arthrobacter sp. SLBN-122]